MGPKLHGAVLVLPGLHPDGIDDRRVDRFCRVLARAGATVGLPELPSMTESVMKHQLLLDTESAIKMFESILSEKGRSTFGVFCISASSLAGLHVATHPILSRCVSRLHLFGGFADWMTVFQKWGTVEPHRKVARAWVWTSPGWAVTCCNQIASWRWRLATNCSLKWRCASLERFGGSAGNMTPGCCVCRALNAAQKSEYRRYCVCRPKEHSLVACSRRLTSTVGATGGAARS